MGRGLPGGAGRIHELALGPTAIFRGKAVITRARSARWLLCGRGPAEAAGIRILSYHRVADERDELAVAPHRFREQMRFLAAEGYGVIDVVEAARRLAGGESAGRVIALSFDDGYRDVADNALPVLEALGFRATVFVATGVTDGTARFGWYECQPALLSWDEVRSLDRESPLSFGAHSVTHPNLLALDEAAARAEISGSKAMLEARLEHAVSAFCYPAGLFGERERRLVADAGFEVAVSCEPGVNVPGTDRLALHRRQIDPRDRLLDFRAKVGGGHDAPPPLRGVYRRLRYGMEGAS